MRGLGSGSSTEPAEKGKTDKPDLSEVQSMDVDFTLDGAKSPAAIWGIPRGSQDRAGLSQGVTGVLLRKGQLWK